MPHGGTLPHTYPHFATGATLVKFGNLPIGYAEDQVEIEERPFYRDVKADSYGGSEGPPMDVQYLGSLVFVRAVLNRFQEANCRQLRPDLSTTAMPDVGQYRRQDNKFYPLSLINKTYELKYLQSFLRQGRSFNVGTRHQKMVLMFECHVDSPCDKILFTYEDALDPCDP